MTKSGLQKSVDHKMAGKFYASFFCPPMVTWSFAVPSGIANKFNKEPNLNAMC